MENNYVFHAVVAVLYQYMWSVHPFRVTIITRELIDVGESETQVDAS